MPRGQSASPYRLKERRLRAYELFTQGRTNRDVARTLRVTDDTAGRYRKEYETRLREQAEENPNLLADVLVNTLRNLEELELIRKNAWREFQHAESRQTKAQFLNVLLKAQDQRAKLFGVLGVSRDYFVRVETVALVQKRLLDFMSRELCEPDRRRLIEYMEHGDLARYCNTSPVIDAEALDVISDDPNFAEAS